MPFDSAWAIMSKDCRSATCARHLGCDSHIPPRVWTLQLSNSEASLVPRGLLFVGSIACVRYAVDQPPPPVHRISYAAAMHNHDNVTKHSTRCNKCSAAYLCSFANLTTTLGSASVFFKLLALHLLLLLELDCTVELFDFNKLL
jgi:hypothetical protein